MLYFSVLIKVVPRYKAAGERLFRALEKENVQHTLLDKAKDIWCRDYMPIKTKSGKYISFRYEPGYLKDDRNLQNDFSADISSQLGLPIVKFDINLDGGNVVFSPNKEKAIVSDRIFTENDMPKVELLNQLEKTLEAEVIIIPSLKSDMTGHADGMVRFVDENTVVANRVLTPYGHESKVQKSLKKAGLTVIDFPFFWRKGNALSAMGCYINYLETENVIFLPVFDCENDCEAIDTAAGIFKKKIAPVNINEIAIQGGLLNCISWET